MLRFICPRTFPRAIPLQGRVSPLGVWMLHHKPCVTSPLGLIQRNGLRFLCSWAELPLFRCQGAGRCQSVLPAVRNEDNGKRPFLILQNCLSPSAGHSYLPDAREVIFQCNPLPPGQSSCSLPNVQSHPQNETTVPHCLDNQALSSLKGVFFFSFVYFC